MKNPAIVSVVVAVALASADGADAAASTSCAADSVQRALRAGAPWLRVTFDGEAFAPDLRARVAGQLRVDFEGRRLDLCEASEAPAEATPLADIALALSPASVLTVEVRDAVTSKRLAREVPLTGVPPDALPLTIALATEELLRASWIEAALASQSAGPAAPPILEPLPPAVRETNVDTLAQLPRSHVGEVAVLAAVDRDTGGQTSFGADVRFTWGLFGSRRLAVGARLGARASLDVRSADGTVEGRELLAGLAVEYALRPREARWGATLGVRGDVLDAQFAGVPSPGAQGSSGSAVGVSLGGVAGAWLGIGAPWRLVAEVAAGLPLRAVAATDSGATATGVSGLQLGFALGLGAAL
jgi:hypothetical protein